MKKTSLQKANVLMAQYEELQILMKGKDDIQADLDKLEAIVTKLWNLGYIVRPLATVIIHDEAHATVLNENSKKWGLVDRMTRLPVTGDK